MRGPRNLAWPGTCTLVAGPRCRRIPNRGNSKSPPSIRIVEPRAGSPDALCYVRRCVPQAYRIPDTRRRWIGLCVFEGENGNVGNGSEGGWGSEAVARLPSGLRPLRRRIHVEGSSDDRGGLRLSALREAARDRGPRPPRDRALRAHRRGVTRRRAFPRRREGRGFVRGSGSSGPGSATLFGSLRDQGLEACAVQFRPPAEAVLDRGLTEPERGGHFGDRLLLEQASAHHLAQLLGE